LTLLEGGAEDEEQMKKLNECAEGQGGQMLPKKTH